MSDACYRQYIWGDQKTVVPGADAYFAYRDYSDGQDRICLSARYYPLSWREYKHADVAQIVLRDATPYLDKVERHRDACRIARRGRPEELSPSMICDGISGMMAQLIAAAIDRAQDEVDQSIGAYPWEDTPPY